MPALSGPVVIGALFGALLLAPQGARAEGSPSLLRIDEVLDEAANFGAFRERPELQRSLLQRLQEIYGADRMPEPYFAAILGNLDVIYRNSPDLVEMAWKKQEVPSPVLEARAADLHR